MHKILLGAQKGEHWTLPMEMDKDSPDGVMFELSLKEWMRVSQDDEGRIVGSVNRRQEGMQWQSESGKLEVAFLGLIMVYI